MDGATSSLPPCARHLPRSGVRSAFSSVCNFSQTHKSLLLVQPSRVVTCRFTQMTFKAGPRR
eukprot:1047520-Pleurochrysis_carterae.AAC.2